MIKTKTLFHTLELHTGTWTIEAVFADATTTRVYLPRHAVRERLPADPWADSPITHDAAGQPLYPTTMLLPQLVRR